ncbi:hypothetical protein [Streptomyces sp. VRA16 Mangrove soil]|uniref:hypothetical protein n=1 Tax=Streptomyces sp. VRA16 Mangrove soil TaxID=2817434 RepID=UPI001A9DBE92|nr:hypothetical protein [Streptomyces sp. VRA16 Mangrove soil]MBO1333314.1 hypothetical protein [Streptomyces sp. VRA16 Mangrove soil]
MGDWWYRNITEPGKLPVLLALLSFIATFLITRTVTRLIRAGRGPFRNVTSGGLHIHHVVPGIVLMVVGGFGAVGSERRGVGACVFAVLFGVGVGLVLDEFALVLHLDDVYWTDQGRQSVEVVVLAAALGGLVVCGFSPLGVNDMTQDEQQDRTVLIVTLVLNFLLVVLTMLKGKPRMALVGVLVPFVAWFGAVRLARPGSSWARRCYGHRHRARARSTLRAYRHDRRWLRISRRFQDLVGGFREPQSAPRTR